MATERKRAATDRGGTAKEHQRAATDRGGTAKEHQRAATDRGGAPTEHQRAATGRGRTPTQHQRAATDGGHTPTQHQRAATDRRRTPTQHQRAATGRGRTPTERQRAAADSHTTTRRPPTATARRRIVRTLAALPALLLLTIPATARAAQPWWEPLAFAGQRVNAVSVSPGELIVETDAGAYISTDAGRTFQTLPTGTSLTPPQLPARIWQIQDGTVVTGPLTPDPRSPDLGPAAHIIAAPAAAPGVVVAVGADNHVWRRTPSGQWATSFVLLPAGGLSGTPQVTALAAFTQPLTTAVYMGTDGYGVLVTEDGGDDWIRADPGLPENILGLATDNAAKALYAATDQGLFVHHLQAFPAPPVYQDASLYLRWLGIAAVALLATVAAVLGLRRALPAG